MTHPLFILQIKVALMDLSSCREEGNETFIGSTPGQRHQLAPRQPTTGGMLMHHEVGRGGDAVIGSKRDGKIRVVMGDCCQMFTDHDIKVHFLHEFAMQGLLRSFPLFHLAARKFPQVTCVFIARHTTLHTQHLAIHLNDGSHHMIMFGLRHHFTRAFPMSCHARTPPSRLVTMKPRLTSILAARALRRPLRQ